ncbi:MAG TPA: trypsin-like peptidase domain-containing protein [Oligoflexia bacterium]|nr:trypsin-like peptidase domain-containing protein [Oligoflexia bacterium]
MNKTMKIRAILGLSVLAIWGLTKELHAASADNVVTPVNQVFIQISKKMIPSVVNIFTTSTVKAPHWGDRGRTPGQPGDELWRRFFEEFLGEPFGGGVMPGPRGDGNRVMPQRKAMSLGSGFVIEKNSVGGLILTNNHVVEGADEIKVKFTEDVEEKESEAEIIGRDRELDIALLKVKTRRTLQPVVLGDSDKLEVGEWIAAVGNPFGHGHSVSHGIVSAKERSLPGTFGNYLQVDAPINPGNSGGPLVNLSGEVVGINNAIDARGPGIGFAIPVNMLKKVLEQLKTKGRVDRGYIGVNVQEFNSEIAKALKLDEDRRGPIVSDVVGGKPAARAGIKKSDVITEVAGKRVRTIGELLNTITNIPIGEKADVTVLRSDDGKVSEKKFKVDVEGRPDFRADAKGRHDNKGPDRPGKAEVAGITVEQIDSEIAGELGLPADYQGVVIKEIKPDSPGIEAGLERGDVIVDIKEAGKETRPVKKVEDFVRMLKGKKRFVLGIRTTDPDGEEVFEVRPLNLTGKKD